MLLKHILVTSQAGHRNLIRLSCSNRPILSSLRWFSTATSDAFVPAPDSQTTEQKQSSEVETSTEDKKSDLVPGKSYRNIDTRVKHLQHMTSEDLAAPDS